MTVLSGWIEVPLKSIDPSPVFLDNGFDSTTGLGDVTTQLLYKPYSTDSLAALIGMRIDWNTATEDETGAGGIIYAPLAAAASPVGRQQSPSSARLLPCY